MLFSLKFKLHDMKKNILLLLPIVGVLGFSFFYESNHISTYHNDGIETVNFGVNPPAGKTGAPGDGNCTDCHSGSTMSSEGVVFFTVGGGPGYMPGSTYPISLSTISGTNNGFELTILDADNNFVNEDQWVSTEDEPDHDGLCQREQEFFLDAIVNDVDLVAHNDDAINSLKIVLAADESFKTGKTIELN